jgi:hypothetical protein
MRYLACRIFPIILLSLCMLLPGGCGGGDGPPSDILAQKEIGPDGGTIEVTDPESALFGVRVDIPAGALAQRTTIVIEYTRNAPSLPDGLDSPYPTIKFSPETTFLKKVEITFPIQYPPPDAADEDNDEILGAFYWKSDESKWSIVPPMLVDNNRMTIETSHFSMWKWGSIFLKKAEKKHFEAWFEDMVDDWNVLMQETRDRFEYLLVPFDDWKQWALCDYRDYILRDLRTTYDWSGGKIDLYLADQSFIHACPYGLGCTRDNFKIFNAELHDWVGLEIDLFKAKLLMDYMPSSGSSILDFFMNAVLKAMLRAAYRSAVLQWDCDYRCMLKNGTFDFYVYMLVHNTAFVAHDGIILFHSSVPCK